MNGRMDEEINFKSELLRSVEQINNRILGFQSYMMRRVWGVLFGIIAFLIFVDSFSFPLVTYFTSSIYLARILNLIIQIAVFLFVIFYWFRLFDNSLRIVRFRERTSTNRTSHSRVSSINWRNAVIIIFVSFVFSSIIIGTSDIPLKDTISSILQLLLLFILDMIMLKGLKNTFLKVPVEGYAVFTSYLALTIFNSAASIVRNYIVDANYLIFYNNFLFGIAVAIILFCAFSFIYHAPDYLEELNEQ